MHSFLQSLIDHPSAFTLGNFEIRWYGLAYSIVFLCGWWWLHYRFPKKSWIDGFTLIIIISGLVGARILFVLLDHHSLTDLFTIRDGGLSWHGGLIAALGIGYWYGTRNNIPVLRVADSLSPVVIGGIILIRFTNFINGELAGTPTNSALGFMFPNFSTPRHAQQLYEAALTFIFGLFLLLITKFIGNRFKSGALFYVTLTGLSVIRFMVEFVRPSEYTFAGLTFAQGASIVIILLAIRQFKFAKD